MDKITQMQQERASLIAKQRKILDKTKEKGMSAEEERKWERMDQDIEDLEEKIEKELKTIEREKSLVEKEFKKEEKNKETGGERYTNAFESWLRRGNKEISREDALTLREKRSMNVANNIKGGYLVPTVWENRIIEKLREESVMRRIATVETTSSETNIPVSTSKPKFGWIDEEGSYPETDSEFGQKSVNAWKLGGIIKISEELLYDNAYNLEGRIERDSVIGLREEEEEAFINGDNIKKPRGLLLDAQIGKEATAADAITADEIIDLVYSVKRSYRRNGRFLLDDPIAKAIRKLKANEQYIWQPGLTSGEPDRLLGYPVEFSFAMPEMTAENKPVAFGDFSYYTIYDRQGMFMQRLDEKYSNTGQVGFKVYRRTDGLLTLEEAAKVIEMSD